MGLLPDVFWSLTWQDYHRISEGFYHRQELEWEQTRWLGALIYNANAPKGKGKKPHELVPLNLDKKRKTSTATQTTQEDVARILDKFKHRLIPKNGSEQHIS